MCIFSCFWIYSFKCCCVLHIFFWFVINDIIDFFIDFWNIIKLNKLIHTLYLIHLWNIFFAVWDLQFLSSNFDFLNYNVRLVGYLWYNFTFYFLLCFFCCRQLNFQIALLRIFGRWLLNFKVIFVRFFNWCHLTFYISELRFFNRCHLTFYISLVRLLNRRHLALYLALLRLIIIFFI